MLERSKGGPLDDSSCLIYCNEQQQQRDSDQADPVHEPNLEGRPYVEPYSRPHHPLLPPHFSHCCPVPCSGSFLTDRRHPTPPSPTWSIVPNKACWPELRLLMPGMRRHQAPCSAFRGACYLNRRPSPVMPCQPPNRPDWTCYSSQLDVSVRCGYAVRKDCCPLRPNARPFGNQQTLFGLSCCPR